MSFESSMREIESHEFGSLLGLANDTSMFFEIAEQQKPVADLIKSLNDRKNQKLLLLRLLSLLKQQEDVRYRNSRDAAIAVYLKALQGANRKYATLAATDAISSPRLWWAKKIASLLLSRSFTADQAKLAKLVDKSIWHLYSPKNRKDILIVDEPSGAWMQSGNIIDSERIEVKSEDSSEEVKEQSGFSVTSGSSAQTVKQS